VIYQQLSIFPKNDEIIKLYIWKIIIGKKLFAMIRKLEAGLLAGRKVFLGSECVARSAIRHFLTSCRRGRISCFCKARHLWPALRPNFPLNFSHRANPCKRSIVFVTLPFIVSDTLVPAVGKNLHCRPFL